MLCRSRSAASDPSRGSADAESQPQRVLAKLTGQPVPEGLLVGVCPRQMIEALLTANVAPEHWREAPWQTQQILQVVVVTRDGFRFGFFPLGLSASA